MPQIARASGFKGTLRVLWLLFAASILIPLLLFVAAAWHSRDHALDEAQRTVEKTTLILHGHAQKVFESYGLVMDRVADRVASTSWAELRQSAEIHELLRGIVAQQTQIGSIWIVDRDGNLLSASAHFPAPEMSVADRPYMRAFRDGYRDLFVGEIVKGRVNGRPLFTVARPILGRDGTFQGAVLVAAFPSYFQDLYRQSAPNLDYSASLVREDGVFLVRDGQTEVSAESARAGEGFRQAIRTQDAGILTGESSNDGVERIIGFQKLSGFPVYVRFALGSKAALVGWWEQLMWHGAVALLAMVGLATMTGLALARIRREQVASIRLAEEMHRREEAEAQLRRAQKMEALGQLTGGIAHDYNNVLTVIMGNLDLLRRAKDEDRRARLIDNAFQATEQAHHLTNRLLVFARRQPLRPEVVNLSEVIARTEDMLVQSLRGDICLDLDLAEALWLVRLDPSQLQVALINMAANARDAMPKGGTLKIKCENTVLRDGEAIEGVALTVSDTGVGMPREVLSRVFEPFFTTKEVGKGTGLGLAQVYGFVQHSGGSIDIRSEEGRGTTITLYLPRAAAEDAVQVEAENTPEVNQRPLAILVVEDNEEVAEMATTLLSERGHSVVRASSANEALSILNAGQRFDLVFSDLVMPGEMDGLDLAREVRKHWPWLPVVLATGYSEAAAEAAKEGFPLLAKPYQPDTLEAAIQQSASQSAETANVIPLPRQSG